MKTRFWVKVFPPLLLVCGLSTFTWAKDYRIDKVSVSAQIREDGSVKISERRVYSFQGEFHWASYRLPLKGIGRVDSFQIREGDRVYPPGKGEGHVQVSNTGRTFEARWFFRARNQTRVFNLSFILRDAVTVYADVAEFYYKFVGQGWDRPTAQVVARVSWQHEASPDSVRTWAHGPLWGYSRILPDGTVEFSVRPLPAHTFWEGRVLFPPSWVPRATRRVGKPALARILAEEAEWAQLANRRRLEALRRSEQERERERGGLWLLGFLSLAAVALVANWYVRFGKRHPTPGAPRIDASMPSDRPPALVAFLLGRGNLGGAVLTATLLDLARRGWLRIEEQELPGGWLRKKPRLGYVFVRQERAPVGDALRPWEEDLLRFLFDEVGQGAERVTERQLKKASGKMRRWFRQWRKTLSALVKQEHLYEETSLNARNKALVLAVSLDVIGVAALFVFGWPGVIPIVVGSLLLIPAVIMPRRTPEAEQEAQRWLALGRYLKRYGEATGQLSTKGVAEAVLPYAVVLGVSKKGLVRLVEDIGRSGALSWFAMQAGTAHSFGESVAGMVSSVTTTMSSATGTGGGASAGGGGGAGGSGGAAG